MLFSRTRQAVLNHIWNNPGATQQEISRAVYHNNPPSDNAIAVHISQIRHQLWASTPYALAVFDPTVYPYRYRIIPKKKGPSSDSPHLAPVL